jgi:serine protease DegQ
MMLSRLFKRITSTPSAAWLAVGLISALFGAGASALFFHLAPKPLKITQDDIDAAVIKTIESHALPSRTANAAEKVRAAVVRVRGFADPTEVKFSDLQSSTPKTPEHQPTPDKNLERSVGSGVLISDAGLILTNLHVVAGSKRIVITFFDGFESDAEVVALRPENDLAVIKAKKLPDDIEPATMGGSGNLRPGDEVVAVGFPFGMGPSVSAGVVSGLNREFRSPEGQRSLTGLIQFDAAANPGNSGGPLINMAGEVVGIVTAIFNPSGSRTFIGIGFAVTMEVAGGALGIPPL